MYKDSDSKEIQIKMILGYTLLQKIRNIRLDEMPQIINILKGICI